MRSFISPWIAALLYVSLLIAGCASEQFLVRQTDAGFIESNHLLYSSENNRLAKEHVNTDLYFEEINVYINPFVEKDKSTLEIITLGFKIINKPAKDRRVATFNRLGKMTSVAFRLQQGDTIKLAITHQKTDLKANTSYETWSDDRSTDPYATDPGTLASSDVLYSSYEMWETGIILVSSEDFARLANSAIVSCEITGTKNSAVYREADFDETFSANLHSFYLNYIQ